VSLPDPCRFLKVHSRDLVVAIRLSLLQVGFLEKLFNEEKQHARVAREEVLYLV